MTGQFQQGCRGQGAEKPCFTSRPGSSSTEKEAAGPAGETMNSVPRVLEAPSCCRQAGVPGYKPRQFSALHLPQPPGPWMEPRLPSTCVRAGSQWMRKHQSIGRVDRLQWLGTQVSLKTVLHQKIHVHCLGLNGIPPKFI